MVVLYNYSTDILQNLNTAVFLSLDRGNKCDKLSYIGNTILSIVLQKIQINVAPDMADTIPNF
jgi:hypothetical protein